jgi:hypothetical protein
MVERLFYSVKFDNGLDVIRTGLCEGFKSKVCAVAVSYGIVIHFHLEIYLYRAYSKS